jgi:hypothetical protein
LPQFKVYVIRKRFGLEELPMDLSDDERNLLADFRCLNKLGKIELLDYASFLIKKYQDFEGKNAFPSGSLCKSDKKG